MKKTTAFLIALGLALVACKGPTSAPTTVRVSTPRATSTTAPTALPRLSDMNARDFVSLYSSSFSLDYGSRTQTTLGGPILDGAAGISADGCEKMTVSFTKADAIAQVEIDFVDNPDRCSVQSQTAFVQEFLSRWGYGSWQGWVLNVMATKRDAAPASTKIPDGQVISVRYLEASPSLSGGSYINLTVWFCGWMNSSCGA